MSNAFETYRKKVVEIFGKPVEENEDSKIEEKTPAEEWVWINGFKGTDKNMVCNNYQYAMDTMFEMPPDEEIKLCSSGFHFCKDLQDVFRYYKLGGGNRFFEVKALVRAVDAGSTEKMVAKSIVFTRELDVDEILKAAMFSLPFWERHNVGLNEWSEDQKKRALSIGIKDVYVEFLTDKLVVYGYSRPFASHIISIGGYDVACAVGSQEDLSMDMKAMYIYQSTLFNALNEQHKKPAYRRY